MARHYKITEDSLSAYMQHTYMSGTAVVGETSDGFILQNGSKVHQVSKNNVEKFALDHGYVPNMGHDAMSEQDKAIFEGNRSRNTNTIKAKESKEATYKDENLEKYHNQLPSTRKERAQKQAFMDNQANGNGPIEGVNYKGNKSYKGTGTNQ